MNSPRALITNSVINCAQKSSNNKSLVYLESLKLKLNRVIVVKIWLKFTSTVSVYLCSSENVNQSKNVVIMLSHKQNEL